MLANKKNTILNLSSLAFSMISAMVGVGVFARKMGIEIFGTYALFQTIIGLLVLVEWGANLNIIKDIAHREKKDKEKIGERVKATLIFIAYGLLLSMALLIIVASIFGELIGVDKVDINTLIWLVFASAMQIGSYMLGLIINSIFKGLKRFDQSSFVNISQSIGNYFLPALLMLLLDAEHAIQILVVSQAISFIFLGLKFRYAIKSLENCGIEVFNGNPRKIYKTWKIFEDARDFGLQGLIAVIFNQGQRLIISGTTSSASLGFYFLAYSLLSKVHLFINSIVEVAFPIMSESKNSREIICNLYNKGIIFSATAALMILSGINFYKEMLLTAWVGQEMALKVIDLIFPLSIVFFLMSLSITPHYILIAIGRQTENLKYSIAGVIFYVLAFGIYFFTGNVDIVEFCWIYTWSSLFSAIFYHVKAYGIIKLNDFE